mmetsp:Transcript_70939/g.195919  ORF Transcript_70939/g.195919 Transcript_70939/m.195919 type:complete len:535 (+) Transcript_70939:91-1695(+)
MMAMPGDDEYDHGPVSPLGSFYEPQLVKALGPYLISEEPPMWVIDAPSLGDGAGHTSQANRWIWEFIEFVEAQAAEDGVWEPFNVKHALCTPPERYWIDGSSPNLHPTEKLAGFRQFLGHVSGCEATFLDEGLRFALKRYPCHGGELPVDPRALINGEFMAAENLHIDRLQQDPDKGDSPHQTRDPSMEGHPTHFTLVVNFDDGVGGTHFPRGRLLPGLGAPPPGVTPAATEEGGGGGGIIVRGRRGRVLLWSNHRGASATGEAKPLLSSLHQSLLKPPKNGNAGSRRVCIFGWAENGRKWERCGFHECLEHESPEVRADFYGRTLLEELEGWGGGPRGGEVAQHLKSAKAQREIQAAMEKGLSDEMRVWLARFGYHETSKAYTLMCERVSDREVDFGFYTLAGNREFGFRWHEDSIEVAQLREHGRTAYGCREGQSVAEIEFLDGAQKITDERAVISAEQKGIVVKLRTMPFQPQAAQSTQSTSSSSYPHPQPKVTPSVPDQAPPQPSSSFWCWPISSCWPEHTLDEGIGLPR